ncbi:FYVE-type zinc finger-containing protein, partial [Lachnellula willkommii]
TRRESDGGDRTPDYLPTVPPVALSQYLGVKDSLRVLCTDLQLVKSHLSNLMFLEKSTQDTLPPSISHDKLQRQPQPARTMATAFAMPVQQFTASPSQSQYTLYNSQSQPISPINSATATPKNASPTSPRTTLPPHLAAHTRQLRPPKSPLYVPAVLRPTDPPKRVSKPSPLTPPQSMHNSFDDLENARTLNRRSTGDSGKFGLGAITEAEFSSEGLGKVTALPTREHWKPDSESSVCDEPACTRYFTYFRRRHHCRRCGNIFCDMHSMYTIPLDQDANYHPRGSRSRSCEHCWSEYRGWQIARSSRSNSESSQDDPQTPTTPTVVCAGNGAKSALGSVFGKGQGMSESLGASVPRDWNWSTF